jgi:hypothetical protein
MADLTITAAIVDSGEGARIEHGTAGAAVTAGQAVYLDPADGTFKLADDNSATAAARIPYGLALHGAAAGQPLTVQSSGPVVVGAALSAGVAYYLSDTPGGICPVADLATGEYPALLGMATSATVLQLDIQTPGVSLSF